MIFLCGCGVSISIYDPEPVAKFGTNIRIGNVSTANVGEVVYSEWSYETITEAFVVSGYRRQIITSILAAPKDMMLVRALIDDEKAYCSTTANFTNSAGSWKACYFDTKSSGILDKAYIVGTLGKIFYDVSIPYKIQERMLNPSGRSFYKHELVYEGLSGHSIKFTYKEFTNSFERPSYQQDLNYNLEPDGSVNILFRGLRMSIVKVDNNEILYVVAKGFRLPNGTVSAQVEKNGNLVDERQRQESEQQRLDAQRQKLTADALERQRLENESQHFRLQQAQLTEKPTRPNAIGPKTRRTALVIGNSAYKSVSPLKNAANDARDIADALHHLGFDVNILTDATQSQMEHAVRDFGSKLRKGGVGLFYYSGHGIQVSGENYLVPVSAVIRSEGDVKYGSVNAGLVLAKMEDAGNGPNIVILDACRSNPFARSFRSATEGLAKMDAPTGSLIAYATAPGSVASDGSGRNGVFTRYLLENMRTPRLPISEVLMRVRQGVIRETGKKQVPWEASSLVGQFYFSE